MTVQAVLAEYCKTAERTVFWDDDRNANVDPFEGTDVGFFATNWDFKVCVYAITFFFLLLSWGTYETAFCHDFATAQNFAPAC